LSEQALWEFNKIYGFLQVNLPNEHKQEILNHLKYLKDSLKSDMHRQIMNIKYNWKLEIVGIEKVWDQMVGAIKNDKAKFWENFAAFRDELGKFNLEMRSSGLINLDGLEGMFKPLFRWANDWFAELEKRRPRSVQREPEKPNGKKFFICILLHKPKNIHFLNAKNIHKMVFN
jgi:hypothetical protein